MAFVLFSVAGPSRVSTDHGSRLASTREASTYQLGYDLSFPQCRYRFPSPGLFAIVGVNGGTASTSNVCLKRELRWASRAPGINGQAGASLYVNTANPGPKGTAWPHSNADPISGYTVADRYGKCAGGNSAACSWQYGWNMAEIDALARGITKPLDYAWWLDVETGNSWQSNRALNRADLTGMADYFQSMGVPLGIYSTYLQWPEIAGPVAKTSPLYGLPEWVSGASSIGRAKSFCSRGKFMPGAVVLFSQWYTNSSRFDGDVSCPNAGFRKIRNLY